MMNGTSDARPRDWFVPFLLLCLRGRDLFGRELLEKIAVLGYGAVRQGEVYRTLRRMEEEGLIFSDKGKMDYVLSRRRYGLTESGEAYLEFLAHSLGEYRKEIEVFFQAYEGPALRGAYG